MFGFLDCGKWKTSMLHLKLNQNIPTGLRQKTDGEPMNMMGKIVFNHNLNFHGGNA